MNTLFHEMLLGLLRTTLFLSVASILAFLLLKLSRCRSPRVHRLAWCAALLQGWLFMQIPWAIAWTPWFLAEAPAKKAVAELPEEFAFGGFPAIESTNPGAIGITAAAIAAEPSKPEIDRQPQPNWADFLQAAWPTAAIGVWLIGLAVVLVRGVMNYVLFVRRLSPSAASNEEWQSEFESTRAANHPCKKISLFVSDNCGPLLCRRRGRYLLVVPQSLWQSLSSHQRIAIVQHELAHYRRGDLWKSLAVRLIALPHWFNPLAWFAVRRFDEAAEWACDELATSDRVPATEYANVLLKLCDGRRPQHAFLPAARGSSVSRRIRRLLAQTKEDSAMKKFAICASAGLVLMLGMFRVRLVGEEVLAEAKPSKQAQAMIDAAEMAYKASASAYDAGTIIMESVYAWSRRWLQAELDATANDQQRKTAYRAHSARMKRIFQKVAALYHGGSKGGEADKYWATVFHVAEAEAMLRKVDPTARDVIILEIKSNGDIDFDGREICTVTNTSPTFDNSVSVAIGRHVELLKRLAYEPAETRVVIQADKEAKFADVTKLTELCKQAGFTHITYKTSTAVKPQTDKQSRINRLYLDLTGLPPSQQQIDEFVKDASPEAYPALVDRLLKTPTFVRDHPRLDMERFLEMHRDVVKTDSCLECHSGPSIDKFLKSKLKTTDTKK